MIGLTPPQQGNFTMASRVILTVIGSDRPGLTAALAQAVLDAGGNWLESHLARLAGRYVGSVLVEIAPDRLGALHKAVADVDAKGLNVSLVDAGEAADTGTRLTLKLVAQDRPGIINELAQALGPLKVNIESLETTTEDGAWSGARLFRADVAASLPDGVSAAEVQSALEGVSAEIMVDLD
jgi:glycine cleavage system regulatory protein